MSKKSGGNEKTVFSFCILHLFISPSLPLFSALVYKLCSSKYANGQCDPDLCVCECVIERHLACEDECVWTHYVQVEPKSTTLIFLRNQSLYVFALRNTQYVCLYKSVVVTVFEFISHLDT